MAEAIPYGAAANLWSTLATVTISEIVKLYGVEDELRKLKDAVSSLRAVLLDAEEKQQKSHALKIWIQRLNQVVYDADDLFDEIQYEDLRKKMEGKTRVRTKVRKFFSSLSVHLRIKDIRERLDGIANDMSNLRVIEEPKIDINWRETSSFVVESETIGRDKDRENIVQQLLHDANVFVTAIVGFGGLGKTTLAQLVYNDVRMERYFAKKMWVCVSDDFNVQLLVKKILQCLNPDQVLNLNLEQLQRNLREQLAGKRYLLVLDDVWNENHQNWVELRKYLKVGASGSKILVTTRSKTVALAMGVESPYILKGLTEDQSWTLFKNFAFREGENALSPGLIEAGENIAKKCKGVPLALKSLGNMLRSCRIESKWLSVQNSELWEAVERENNIFQVLRLSYDHLPTHLRQCFSYCAMFPKDYEFDKETLIYLWMAQGYIQSKREVENSEEIGDEYFNELLVRSFFQEFKDSKGGVFYKMHDLIHDLAKLTAGDSCFVASEHVSEMTRHVYLSGHYGMLKSNKGVRTLFVGKESSLSKYGKFLSNHKRLRAICLLDAVCSWRTLSSSIGNLKHLRFLDISKIEGWETLPNSITSLFYLETVVVNATLKSLPRDVEKLINLQYFIIRDDCGRRGHTPIGLGKVTRLHKLSYFALGKEGLVTLNELSGLNQLRGNMIIYDLDDAYRPDLEDILKEKEHLTALKLHWSRTRYSEENDDLLLNKLEPHPNLKELHLEGYRGMRFSSWISSITRNLVRVQLKYCKSCGNIQFLEHLPSLQTIHLDYLPALEFISDKNESSSSSSTTTMTMMAFFPSLKDIKFEYCENLKGWWKRDDDVVELPLFPPCQSFPCLSTLFISRCPKLTWMPLFPSLDSDLSLIESSGKPLLDTLSTTPATSASTSHSSSSSVQINTPLSKLKTLTLEAVYDVESLSEEWLKNLTSLEGLHILSCKRIRSLTQGLQHLTSLEELEIVDCPELELSNDEDENDNGTMHWQGLSSLRSLTICGIPKLVCLPNGLQCATSLSKLVLKECSNLTGLPGWIRNFKSLKRLTIKDCPKVTSLEAISPLATLQTLSIMQCPHLSRRYGNNKAHDWSAVAHIQNISIDYKTIQEADNYLSE